MMAFNFIKKALIAFLMLSPGYVLADQFLDQVKSSINSPPITRGNFIQLRTLIGVSKRLTSEGYFVVDKSRGILWITEKPIYQALAVTSSGITVSNKSNILMSLSSRNDPSVRYVNELLLAIFSGDITSLDKLFTHTGEITVNGWAMELIPRNSASTVFTKVAISGNSSVNRITFTSKEGDLTDITFANVKPVASLTKDEVLQLQ